MRIVNLLLGLLFLGVGIVGIFLPVIPTTGPLLLALWFFARSSKRLHDWLVNHRVLGKYVHELWVRGGLTVRSKRRAITAMSSVIVLSAALLPFGLADRSLWIAEGGLWVGWALGTIYIATRKTLGPLPLSGPQTPRQIPGESP